MNNSITSWQQARKLFEQYIEKPVDEALDEINNNLDMPEAVKSKLIKLVKSQSQDDTQFADADLSFFDTISHEQEDLSGKNIGEYRLIKRIGSGGMSNVYKAKRKGSEIQKFIALKLISTNELKISDELKILFKREQLSLSKLNHPNIISFHHGGISKNGIPFMVMDFVESARDIKEYVENEGLSSKQIIKLIQKVADALSYAHQNFIIHKDIKPNNILIDEHGNPKVVDFGIATLLETDNKPNVHQIFTPDYASPEQILDQHITPNSDVFSLSAVLLELLIKKKPLADFEINKYKPQADVDHVNALLTDSGFEKDLIKILNKGLMIDSKKRYQTMVEFNIDLDNWLRLKPILASNQSSLYSMKKLIQRHKVASLAVLALFTSVVVGVILTVDQKNQAQFEAIKAQQVTDFLLNSIQASDPDITKGKDVSVKELLKNATIKIQEGSIDDVQLATVLKQTLGKALAKIGEYSDSEKLLLQAANNSNKNFKARISLAQLYLKQQLFDKANEQLDLLKKQDALLSSKDKNQVEQIQAESLYQQGDFNQAISQLKRLIKKQRNKGNAKELIGSKLLLARILDENGRLDESINIMRETLKFSQDKLGEVSTSSTNIAIQLARTLSNTNPVPWDEINRLYQRTLKNQVTLYGKYHPIIARTYLHEGFAFRSSGKPDKALSNAKKARKIALISFGEEHMLTAHIDLLISQINVVQGNMKEAINKLSNVVKVYEKHYGTNHFETNQTKTTLSVFFLRDKRPQEALNMLLPLYESQKQQLGEFNKATFYVRLSIVKANMQLGHHQKAIEEGRLAHKQSLKHLGKVNTLTLGFQMVLASLYINTNQSHKAIKICQELLSIDLIKNHKAYNARVNDLLTKAQSLK